MTEAAATRRVKVAFLRYRMGRFIRPHLSYRMPLKVLVRVRPIRWRLKRRTQ